MFDIAFVGHFTKDTIENAQGSTVHLGGAFYYGAHVAARMGLRAAVITRLAREDWQVVEELERLGVRLFATATQQSTHLRIVYPTDNLDERTIYVAGNAGAFSPEEVTGIQARVFHIGASVRGEVPLAVIQTLEDQGARISLDVQGFIRINAESRLVYAPWPDMPQVLSLVNVLKADGTEAEFLTGRTNMREAMKVLASFGPQEVLLTENQGLTVLANGEFHQAPWKARAIKGRTGRGDTCTAAYLGKRASAGPAEATRFAAALTGLKLEAPGPFRGPVPADN